MIVYNVIPYKDEVLYSIIARYLYHSIGSNMHRSLIKLFGNGQIPACIDLPGSLDKLFNNLFFISLYPFYQHFFKFEKRDRILKYMIEGGTSLVHVIAGINSSSMTRSRFPRYCPQCARESIQIYGEAYWKRVHNIPGMLLCTSHNVLLFTQELKLKKLNFSQFVSPNELQQTSLLHEINSDNNLLSICKLLENSLRGDYAFDINSINYRELIGQTKYLNGKRINYLQLLEDMVKWYGENALRNYFPQKSLLHWVPGMVRSPLTYFNPVKHVLLNEFLIHAPSPIQPTLFKDSDWDGPWNCINPICRCYETDKNTDIKVFLDSTLNRTVAVVKCKCEMAYKCSYTLFKGKKKRIITINEYGSKWKDQVLSLSKSGHSALSISKRLKVSSGVILRFLKRESKDVKDLKFQSELVKKRNKWIVLLNSFDSMKITNSIKANGSLYRWLFNHDHPWLKVTNRLHAVRPEPMKLRMDWETIDGQMVAKISEAIVTLNSQNYKGRITLNLISKIIKKEKNYLINHKLKIPNTVAFLEKVIEPFEQYQIRRLEASIIELHSQCERLTFSKIVKNSGLKSINDPSVKKFLEERLRKSYCA
jgi:Tn7-like transposition protein D/TniQ